MTERTGDPTAADRIAREIGAIGARAVIIQHQPGLIQWDVLAELLLDERLAGRAVILTLHNLLNVLNCPELDRVRGAFRRASRLLVHNVRDLNLLKSWDLVANAALLPPGALRPTIERHPARTFSRSAAPVIGTYGFILPDKGNNVLIEAFAKVRNNWPGAKLRMVTAEYPAAESQAEIARCQTLAHSLGVQDAVEWHTDCLPDESSLALLNRCDLLVLPRRESLESASGAVRVAMASHVPVLVTPVELFDEFGDAVIRTSGLDTSALASGIAGALRDQGRRDQVVDKADRWLEAHDWARMSERLRGMIWGVLASEETQANATVATPIAD